MAARDHEVIGLWAKALDELNCGCALEEVARHPEHRCVEWGVGSSARLVRSELSGAVHDPDASCSSLVAEVHRVSREVDGGRGISECGKRGEVAHHSSLELHGHNCDWQRSAPESTELVAGKQRWKVDRHRYDAGVAVSTIRVAQG